MVKYFAALTSLLVALLPSSAIAKDKGKGYAIAEAADKFHAGFVDSRVDGTMVLRDSSGKSSTRSMKVSIIERDDGNDTLIVFSTPKDVKDTALLTNSFDNRDDDQWIFLPAVKRVKRIATGNRSGPFLGSEFTYEDLVPKSLDKYRYEFVKEEPCDDTVCNVITAVSLSKKPVYSMEKIWITKKDHLTKMIEFYDAKKEKFKVLKYSGYKRYKNKHWAAKEVTMSNLKTKKSTTFKYDNHEFGVGLKAKDFNHNVLQRGS